MRPPSPPPSASKTCPKEYPLQNRFTLESPPTGAFSVSFYINDYDGLPLQIDNKGSDGWSKEFDMGSVRPGARLHVVALSLTGDTLDSQVVPLEVIPAPHWLKGAKIYSMSVDGSTVSFTARSLIYAIFQGVPSGDADIIAVLRTILGSHAKCIPIVRGSIRVTSNLLEG